MTKKRIRINHSTEQVDVTVPSAEDAPETAQNVAEPEPIRAMAVYGIDIPEDAPQDVAKFTPVPAADAIQNAINVLNAIDNLDAWNTFFFAIKALKNNPSEALKASKMRRLLEKLP